MRNVEDRIKCCGNCYYAQLLLVLFKCIKFDGRRVRDDEVCEEWLPREAEDRCNYILGDDDDTF